MPNKMTPHRFSFRDHLTAYLVVLVILTVMVVGVFVLYMSGILDPVYSEPVLVGAGSLELATPPPEHGEGAEIGTSADTASIMSWLFASAVAEEAPEAEAATEEAEEAAGAPQSEDELSTLLEQIVAEESEEEEIPADQHVVVDKNDLSRNANLPDGVYNVLLLATDSRSAHATGRSDVMIIASLNMQTSEIMLSSLSRDMWVNLPGGIGQNKLNAAFAYGGPLFAVKTVNETFEMNIEDYVVVDFSTMAQLVDSLGGVDIQLTGMEYAYINYNVAVSEDYEGFAKSSSRRTLTEEDAENVVHLDGLQAVSYARIRKMDSDIQRGSRQRILLQAMMDRALSNLSVSTFYGMATSMMNSTSTNIKLSTVMDIGNWLLAGADFPTMHELSIPVAGSYRGERERELDVLKFNQQQNVEELHAFIYGEYIPAITPES